VVAVESNTQKEQYYRVSGLRFAVQVKAAGGTQNSRSGTL
jgi:hypothetical protein